MLENNDNGCSDSTKQHKNKKVKSEENSPEKKREKSKTWYENNEKPLIDEEANNELHSKSFVDLAKLLEEQEENKSLEKLPKAQS